MGGKSGPANSQMVGFELQQAQAAQDKENKRLAQLEQGKTAIDQLFGPDNFGDPFFDKYKQAELDYSLPQLTTQYGTAKRGMENDLARSGLLRSGAAGYAQSLLENQNAVNEAGLRTKADTDTAALRNSIASQQQQAYNQLYATNDPTVAANTAATSVANAQLAQPNTGALGDLFKPIAIGASAAAAPLYGQYQANQYLNPSSGRGGGSVTNTQS